MAFVFYDTETTGKDTCFDQILQFAAIKTDDDLNPIETFNIRCRLLPHVVPSPGALLATGVSVADLASAPLSHFEMMRQVRAKMNEWCREGAIFIGWNSIRFDEAMLRQAYYQSLLPVYQTNTNGNGRADMMRIAQAVSACIPNAIQIPIEGKCKRTFKLELVAEANGIRFENAHEALADAEATLAVAHLVKQREPQIWGALVANARKANVLQLIGNNSVLLLSETFGGSPFNMIVGPISASCSNPNEWALFDLQFDPEPLLTADDKTLRNAMDGNPKKIRRVSTNAQPPLLSTDFAPTNVRGGRLAMEIYLQRASKVRDHPNFRHRVSRLLGERYADQPTASYVEQRIYDGFPSHDDEARLAAFHRQEWPRRTALIPSIDDERYRELGERVIATEQPLSLTATQRTRWQEWREERLLATGDVPWLTLADAFAELEEFYEAALGDRREQLCDIRQFLRSLEVNLRSSEALPRLDSRTVRTGEQRANASISPAAKKPSGLEIRCADGTISCARSRVARRPRLTESALQSLSKLSATQVD
jgi:exodeoxyribonuclease I